MAGNGRTSHMLGYRQLRALRNLLSQPTIRAAAQAAGLGERTIHRFLQNPHFQQVLEAARLAAEEAELEAHRDLLRKRLSLARRALQVAEELLVDPETPPQVRAALVARFVEGSDVAADRLGPAVKRLEQMREDVVCIRWDASTQERFRRLEVAFRQLDAVAPNQK